MHINFLAVTLLLFTSAFGQPNMESGKASGSWSFVTYFGNATLNEVDGPKYNVRYMGGGLGKNTQLHPALQLRVGVEGYRVQGNRPDDSFSYVTHHYIKVPVSLCLCLSVTERWQVQTKAGLFAAHHLHMRQEFSRGSDAVNTASPGTVLGLNLGFGMATTLTKKFQFLIGMHYQSDVAGWYKEAVTAVRLNDVYAISMGVNW